MGSYWETSFASPCNPKAENQSESPESFQPPGSETEPLAAEIEEVKPTQPGPKMQVAFPSEHKDADPQPPLSAFARVTFKPHRRPDGELKPAEVKAGWETSKGSFDRGCDLRKDRPLGVKRVRRHVLSHDPLVYGLVWKAKNLGGETKFTGGGCSVEH